VSFRYEERTADNCIYFQHIGKIRPVSKVVIFRISAIKVNLWYSQRLSKNPKLTTLMLVTY